ncbi:dual specificity phosphatase 12 [Halocaridina rubra]|uniref:Dual specificity phosphatase 12 n=1 Tax=Halocaridina rubra TaxID=373956 RepID=A0AAN9A7G2_HALRR
MDEDEEYLPESADLNKIEEGLYLGNITAALDTDVLKKYRISHILTVDSKPLPTRITELPGMSFLYIEVDDIYTEDILCYFEEAIKFIEDGQQKGSTFVHCYFGMSRSATLVMAFLMKKYKLNLDEALNRVKERRRCIGPNPGFLKQLLLYHSMGWQVMETNIQYRLYRMEGAGFSLRSSYSVSKEGSVQFLEKFHDLIQPDPRTTTSESDPVALRCRTCRSGLVRQGSLLPHCPKESPGWSNSEWSGKSEAFSLCAQGIYTLPIAWMGDILSELQGKIMCPKCRAKIGSYDWIKGHQCPCGANIKPAFHIIPSKIDKCIFG